LVALGTALALVISAAAAGAMPAGVGIIHPGEPAAGQGTVAAAGSSVGAAAYSNPGVLTYGDATFAGSPTNLTLAAPIVTMAATRDGKGYWLLAADGGIFTYGDAVSYGSAGGFNLYAPIVGMAPTPDGKGYWLVALDGGIFSFGDAKFYGSTGGVRLNSPIVGMAATTDGKGYWLVAADGGMFAFGDAPFEGSTGGITLNSAVVGMAPTTNGKGYWLVAADGGLFAFGNAPFEGSEGGSSISASVAGMATTPDAKGYWLAGSGGAVYPFGDAVSYGNNAATKPEAPIAAIAATPTGKGYWLLEPDAFPTAFTHPGTGSKIVSIAASQVQANPDAGQGRFCNPYGPCEAWCALFATWAWEMAGIPIPHYAFVGDIYTWAVTHTVALSATQTLQPGDAVLYGTGPSSVATAVHMGIIAQVWPDGAIDTIEGDSGPGPDGFFSVNINGPFLPTHSLEYNGVGIFAVAVP
jgi:hypothetical protein